MRYLFIFLMSICIFVYSFADTFHTKTLKIQNGYTISYEQNKTTGKNFIVAVKGTVIKRKALTVDIRKVKVSVSTTGTITITIL